MITLIFIFILFTVYSSLFESPVSYYHNLMTIYRRNIIIIIIIIIIIYLFIYLFIYHNLCLFSESSNHLRTYSTKVQNKPHPLPHLSLLPSLFIRLFATICPRWSSKTPSSEQLPTRHNQLLYQRCFEQKQTSA